MITNHSGLTESQWATIERCLRAALHAVDPQQAVQNAFRGQIPGVINKCRPARIRLVGVGKAVYSMARGLVQELGSQIEIGLLIAKHIEEANGGLPGSIRVIQGDHPVPGPGSLAGANEMAEFLSKGREDDLVICLISGGGSALMTMPNGLELTEMQELTRLLLASGADIGEINTLRKHLDQVKGGGLVRMAAPARMITLILSDVVGNPLDVIASGPTVADSSTYEQALAILHKYHLEQQAPRHIVEVLQRGARGEIPETVKDHDPMLSRVQNWVIGSNILAAEAGLAQARQEGFSTMLLTTYLRGEARNAGEVLSSLLCQVNASGQPIGRPACLVAGGETTVTLKGRGLGGRNQELALGAASGLAGIPGVALVSLGTDGEDGPTDAAGALVTGETMERAKQAGLDLRASLLDNNSYHFFKTLGNLVITGPTGTNVNDLVFLFAF